MTTFGDQLYQLGGVPVGSAVGAVGLAGGKVFFVDVANGTAGGSGKTPADANNSIATAFGYCTSGNNDCVVVIGNGSAWAPTTTLVWNKSYTHLIGAAVPLPGMGSRCRIEGSGASLTPVITVSGSGCLFSNLKIVNNATAASGAVDVTGGRNMFVDCMIFGMSNSTAGARATAYSVHVSGEENNFQNCVIGTDTALRGAANSELIVSGSRNRFTHCEFRSHSETAGKFLVRINSTGSSAVRDLIIEDCLFYNFSTNHATKLTDAITQDLGQGTVNTYDLIFRGDNPLVGCSGMIDVNTFTWTAAPVPAGGAFLAVNTS